jgi:lipoteichoic acid synthase
VTRPPTTPCARAILSAIITTIVVVWLARALAIYQIPAIRLLPRLWMRLPSLALLLAASEIALIAAIGLIALLISATSKAALRILMMCTVVSLLAAVCLLNLANVEILRVFGAPATVGLAYYSDFLGSEHGRSAVISWMPRYLIIAVALVPVIAIAALGLLTVLLKGASLFAVSTATAVACAGSVLLSAFGSYLADPPVRPSYWKSATMALALSAKQLDPIDGAPEPSAQPTTVASQVPAAPITSSIKTPIRNVVVIVLESVAAEYLDTYGGSFHATPRLRQLAAESLTANSAYAHAVSSNVSMVSLLTATYPWISLKTITNDAPEAALQGLPAVLREHGFRTAFFHSSDTRYLGADRFLERTGFDVVQDYRTRQCDEPRLVDASEFYSEATSDRCTFHSLRAWLKQDPSTPSFGVVWTFQQHYPYFRTREPGFYAFPNLQSDSHARELKTRYLDAIFEADEQIGDLVDELKANGMSAETLLIVTGDHGEAFQQHGSFGHGNGLYEEEVRVPLILINPQLFSGQSTERLMGHADVAPSILHVLNVPPPSEWQGRSIFRADVERPVFFFSAWLDYTLGYRFAERKTIVHLLGDNVERYDLRSDPHEIRSAGAGQASDAAETALVLQWARAQNQFISSKIASGRTSDPRETKARSHQGTQSAIGETPISPRRRRTASTNSSP